MCSLFFHRIGSPCSEVCASSTHACYLHARWQFGQLELERTVHAGLDCSATDRGTRNMRQTTPEREREREKERKREREKERKREREKERKRTKFEIYSCLKFVFVLGIEAGAPVLFPPNLQERPCADPMEELWLILTEASITLSITNTALSSDSDVCNTRQLMTHPKTDLCLDKILY